MKTASIPSLRVTPELRESAERVLRDGETLSSFVGTAIRDEIFHRESQSEFIRRGLMARDEAQRTGEYFTANEALDALDAIAEQNAKARGS